jgi:hypothetical protein
VCCSDIYILWIKIKFLEKLISIYPKVVDLILNSEKVFNQLESSISKLPDSFYQGFKRNNSPLFDILNKRKIE